MRAKTSVPAKLVSELIAPPPLTTRDAPSVTLVGRYVIVFGGTRGNRGVRTAQTGGAVFDRATGKWNAMAEPPFDQPLFKPAAIAVANRLLVVGAPCRTASTESGEALCEKDVDLVAASYDPSRDTWVVLPAADLLPQTIGRMGAAPAGWTDSRAVFYVVFHDKAALVAYDTTTQGWERIPFVDGIPDMCSTSDAILAMGQADSSTRPAAEFATADVVTFTYLDGAWHRAGREPQPVPDQQTSYTTCGPGVAVYVPWVKGDHAGATSWFGRDGWRQMPVLDVPSGSRVDVSALGDGTRLIEYSNGSTLHVFASSSEHDAWTERDTPNYGDAQLVGGDDTFLLVPTDPVRDGLFIGTI